MNIDSAVKAVLSVAAPLAGIVGFGSRRRRWRTDIRENLSLVKLLEEDPLIRDHTPAVGWLKGRIAIDVARLAGQALGTPKKPLPWGSLATSTILLMIFGSWTGYIDRHGFSALSLLPGTVAFFALISILGMTTNRELPPEQSDALPPGATPVRTDSAAERIASAVNLASSGGTDGRFEADGQVGVVLAFVEALREGRYVEGLVLADPDWTLCRIQAWLWNNRSDYGKDVSSLQALADSLRDSHQPAESWATFVAVESAAFEEAWTGTERYGAASRRRRLTQDCDVVILAPTGETGGYFVTAATQVPNAMPFVVRRRAEGWRIANHVGVAPAQPGWPPIWWVTDDSTLDGLPEAEFQ